ncbi:MAG: hypothetical protein U0905_00670 [Pirellulales bacterium]
MALFRPHSIVRDAGLLDRYSSLDSGRRRFPIESMGYFQPRVIEDYAVARMAVTF